VAHCLQRLSSSRSRWKPRRWSTKSRRIGNGGGYGIRARDIHKLTCTLIVTMNSSITFSSTQHLKTTSTLITAFVLHLDPK
jgi:hypothetical protein